MDKIEATQVGDDDLKHLMARVARQRPSVCECAMSVEKTRTLDFPSVRAILPATMSRTLKPPFAKLPH